jgi:hypothetical protein
MLQEHQREFQRHLGDQAKALSDAREQAGQLASQVQGLLNQMQNGSPEQRAAAAAQLRQMMASQAMQGAMAAAERAQSQAQAAAATPGQAGQMKAGQAQVVPTPGAVNGGMSMYRGTGVSVDLSGIDLGDSGQAVYRLPPRLREPLIQGMQERGPEGYQPLIDAYYRQISRDASDTSTKP